MTALSISHLSKSFAGHRVLDDISLDVESGDFVAILGPSGCGKSTLLRMIAGLDRQDEGRILLNNEAVEHVEPAKRDMAMVFQSYALYPHMTVAENMASPLRMRRLSGLQRLPILRCLMPGSKSIEQGISDQVEKIASLLRIDDLLQRKPANLSGGQRQRVAIGRALVRQPSVFLMDEPLSNLDYNLRVQMQAELVALHEKLRTTVIYITHDQTEAMTMANKIAVMKEGRVLQFGTPMEVFRTPANQAVAQFVGNPSINLVRGKISETGMLTSGSMRVQLRGATPQDVSVGIRPGSLDIFRRCENGAGWHGKVFRIEHLGADIHVRIKLNDDLGNLLVQRPVEDASLFEQEQSVLINPRNNDFLLFDSAGNRLIADLETKSFPDRASARPAAALI